MTERRENVEDWNGAAWMHANAAMHRYAMNGILVTTVDYKWSCDSMTV